MTLPVTPTLSPRRLRPLGRTDVRVTQLGFGAAAIGNLYQPVADDVAASTIQAALDGGMTYFDTAPHYGFGLSETRLGATLGSTDAAREIVVSTKVGRVLVPAPQADPSMMRHGFVGAAPYEPVFDYTYDGVMRSFEASCKRLRREGVDILFAHDLGRVTHGQDHPQRFREFVEGGYRAMCSLRDAGVVKAIGIGANEWQICEESLQLCDFDCFLLAGRYTLLEQTALDSFLSTCEERRVSIVLGGPFNSGILAEGTHGKHPPHYNYEPAPPPIIERVARLERICAAHETPLAAAALQFPLAHPCVVSVIPGMASSMEIAAAIRLMEFRIPPSLWDHLRTEGLLHPAAPTPELAR